MVHNNRIVMILGVGSCMLLKAQPSLTEMRADQLRGQRDVLLRKVAGSSVDAVLQAEKDLAQAEYAVGIARRRDEQRKLLLSLCNKGISCDAMKAEEEYQRYDREISFLRNQHNERLKPLEVALQDAVSQLVLKSQSLADQIGALNRELSGLLDREAQIACGCRAAQLPALDLLFV